MKNNTFFSGFIYGTLFTLLIGGISVCYYRIAAEMKYHQHDHASGPAVKSQLPLYVSPSPSRGPANAPVTVTEYADFFCGYCKRAMPAMKKISETYPDKVRQIFKHHPLSNTPGKGSFRAHEAAVCAQEQGKFWEFQEKVFAAPSSLDDAGLQAIASQTGLNIPKYTECLKSGRAISVIQADLAEGSSRGIQGTPYFLVNETVISGTRPFEKFQQIIESYLKTGKPPADMAANNQAPVPPAPPAKVEFNDLKGRPAIGPENAPVTLVEFSDYHCPFCQRLDGTVKKVIEAYKDKVRVVWRHFPLDMHAGADRTHQASECAHEQGKFWPFHDKIFSEFKHSWTDADYEKIAKETGLDNGKFKSCMQSDASKKKVQEDIVKGKSSGVRGTPAIFLNGILMSGAQPFESYKAAIDEALKQSAKK